jgi:hypothetical protein
VALASRRLGHGRQLVGQRLAARQLHRVLEPQVEVDPLVEVDHRPLEAGSLLRVDGLGGRGLVLDLAEEGADLLEGEVAVGLRELLADQREDVWIVDHEGGLGVRQLGPEEDVEEPLVGPHGPRLLLPAQLLFEAEAHLAADHQQRIARHRVDGLDAPALQHRQPAEGVEVHPTHRPGRQEPGGHPRQRQHPYHPRSKPGESHVMPPRRQPAA